MSWWSFFSTAQCSDRKRFNSDVFWYVTFNRAIFEWIPLTHWLERKRITRRWRRKEKDTSSRHKWSWRWSWSWRWDWGSKDSGWYRLLSFLFFFFLLRTPLLSQLVERGCEVRRGVRRELSLNESEECKWERERENFPAKHVRERERGRNGCCKTRT